MQNVLAINDVSELNILVAENIFKAKVIGKEGDPEAKLLVGWYGTSATKPMRHNWRTAVWHRSEESAWLDCPKFAEDISSAWEVVEAMHEHGIYIDIETFADFYQATPHSNDGGVLYESIISHPKAPIAICKAALLALEDLPKAPVSTATAQ